MAKADLELFSVCIWVGSSVVGFNLICGVMVEFNTFLNSIKTI